MPIQILMPALSPTMTEGKLAKWLKREGEVVAGGDVIAEIETDKATMELEAVEEGVLARLLVAAGSEGIPVNTPIALLLEEGEDPSALDEALAQAPAQAPTPAPPSPEPAAPVPKRSPAPQPPSPGHRLFASPLARRLAERAGLDLGRIQGSGPKGRIVKRDVEAAATGGALIALPAATPEAIPGEGYSEIPNTTMRKVIAQRLMASKRDIPHFYLTIDCRLDALLDLRRELNAKAPQGEGAYKVSINDFVVRAVALALRQVPAANATWTEDAVRRYRDIDVALAVATPGGLITPVIRNADNKGLADISREAKELAARAHQGKLMPEDYQGGGFTVSNLGMFGIKEFAAIINPPQSCILAVGAGERRPVVSDGALAIATVMTCTLSVDHRSVDGAIGAEFLAAFKGLVEDPLTMLL